MYFRLPLITVAALALHVASARVTDGATRKESDEAARIVRGQEAAPGQFPYAAALFYENDFICTSSILSPTTVMTAAHCVVLNGEEKRADQFHAIANVDKTADNVRIEFEGLTVHPDYNDQSIDNDIAVFKTKDPIPMSDETGPVCIARPNTPMDEYKNATAMGWGSIWWIWIFPIIPDKLQYVEQEIVSNSKCSWTNGGVNDDKICAKGFFNGICSGDSGGPLVHLSADKPPVQIGIASYINGLLGCGTLSPAVSTRVSSHYDFIMTSANDASICTV